jgi:hypothetical protein
MNINGLKILNQLLKPMAGSSIRGQGLFMPLARGLHLRIRGGGSISNDDVFINCFCFCFLQLN